MTKLRKSISGALLTAIKTVGPIDQNHVDAVVTQILATVRRDTKKKKDEEHHGKKPWGKFATKVGDRWQTIFGKVTITEVFPTDRYWCYKGKRDAGGWVYISQKWESQRVSENGKSEATSKDYKLQYLF